MVTITSGAERWAEDEARARRVDLGYQPFAKQQQFHGSPAKYRLFGGAAGPGKSKALLMEAILQAHEHAGANTLLLRRTFPELEQSLLLYFRRDVPRELYQSFNESKHLVTWWNNSTTRFGYCQSENDVYQYQGAEFLFIGIDELTLFTLRQWQFLTSRNRCPVPGAFPSMAGATNPGNIGHAWVKSLWIDKRPAPGMENPDAYDPADYDFIPARVSDNPIYAADENYLKTLRALPSHLKRAFLDGDWDVFAGQYFDRFDFMRHVARAEEIGWKPWWPRWISIDWGFEHPAAVYWHAAVPQGLPVGHSEATTNSGSLPARPCGTQKPRTPIPEQRGWVGDNTAASIGAAVPSTFAGHSTAVPLQNAVKSPGSAHAAPSRVVTYREYVTHRTPPRELAREIIARSLASGPHSEERSDEASLFSCGARITATSKRDSSPGQSRRVPHDGAMADGRIPTGATRERIEAIYLSPDAFARRTDEASIAEQMGDVFAEAGLPRPVPADDDRIGGWMLMYQMLDAGEWLLTENCIELIRTLPNLVRDPARVEDVEKTDGDDAADAARYGLKSRYGVRRGGREHLPLAERLAARVLSDDPTIRAMQARKAQVEEARRSRPVPFPRRRR